MKRRFLHIIPFVMFFCCFSCSTTKNLPEEELLYKGLNKITIINKDESSNGDEALSEVNIDMEQEILNDIMSVFKDATIIYVTHKKIKKPFTKVIKLEAAC